MFNKLELSVMIQALERYDDDLLDMGDRSRREIIGRLLTRLNNIKSVRTKQPCEHNPKCYAVKQHNLKSTIRRH